MPLKSYSCLGLDGLMGGFIKNLRLELIIL